MIPLGQWDGEGTFVYETWGSQEPATQPAEPSSLHRSYATHLTVRRVEAEGRRGVALDIRSERGALPDLGDETHLTVALLEAKRASEAAALYDMPDWHFNPGPDETLDLDKQGTPFAASCIKSGETTILRIRYDDNFCDTFRFRGDVLDKDGLLHTDDGLIHWSEKLKRRE